ncbi:fasciclin domain-containing protein [Croceimicrobium sp.]|uniref:fasciclin domain-containing protein n=1 Tax=Croceimicrobium sp. TaxID=2828340 RepID=UPI003BAAD7AB
MKFPFFRILLISFSLVLGACSDDDDSGSNNNNQSQSLNATLSADSRFSILVDGLKRTGLESMLESNGNFTIFAPTDAAFTAWITDQGYSDLDGLIQGIGMEAFKDALAYHLLKGDYSSVKFQSGYYSTLAINAEKDSLHLYLDKGAQLTLNGNVQIQEANIEATNGTIHAISAVNFPLSVYGLIEVNPAYSSFEAAIGLADGNLKTVLSNQSLTYTFFAPSNAAFDSLVNQTPNVTNLFELVASLGTDKLADVILYHGTNTGVLSSELQTGNITTLADNGLGSKYQFFVNIGVKIKLIDNNSSTEDAVLVKGDLIGTNGVVHFIDAVLLPE